LAKSKFANILKKDIEQKVISENEKIRIQNKQILKEIIGKKVIIKSSHSKEEREYFVDDIIEVYTEGAQGLIPAFKLVNKSLAKEQQIVLNYPKVLIDQDELFDGKKFLILEYEPELDIVKSFRHLHKPNREPLLIYIYY